MKRWSQEFAGRQTARLGLPLWLRVLVPLLGIGCVFGLTAAIFGSATLLHRALHTPGAKIVGSTYALMFFPSFLAALAPGFLVANFLLRLIPPARRALEKAAADVPRASYRDATRDLVRLATVLVPLGLLLALLGVVEPWKL